MKEKYTLAGVDRTAYSVVGYVRRAMKECHKTKADIYAYTQDAMSSNYAHMVNVSIDMVDKLNEELANEEEGKTAISFE